MKPSLSRIKGIKLLKRNEKLLPGSIYMIGSESVSRNLYFRRKGNLETMHLKIRQHLKIVAEILEYVFTPYGFVLVIKTKEEIEIQGNYRKLQERKKKEVRYEDVSKIISEQIRHAISTGNRLINAENGKSGGLSHSNFFRYVANEFRLFHKAIARVKKGLVSLCRQNRRYRAMVRKWDEGGVVCEGDLGIEVDEGGGYDISYLIDIECIADCVGQTLANSTYKAHFNPT